MHINNELGSVNDIKSIGEYARSKGIIFHVDAAQSTGKLKIDVKEMNVDLMSLTAGKLMVPKVSEHCMFQENQE